MLATIVIFYILKVPGWTLHNWMDEANSTLKNPILSVFGLK